MPLQTAEFFTKWLPPCELPLQVDDAVEAWHRLGLKIDEDKFDALVQSDSRRLQVYGETLIKVRGLTHTYPSGFTALQGADLDIRSGEFLAVIGQNGSGKTTLVKHLNGLLYPTEGKVMVKDKDTRAQSLRELSCTVGYVFQNPDHQIFAETVFEEVAFGPRLQGQTDSEIKANVQQALEAVGLTGQEEKDPFSMSKGERQRVAVASIVATRPEVIIMDEPTTGLDYHQIRASMEMIKELNQRGHTIIMVTHNMWVVAEYAHRAVVIKDGSLILKGTPREIFSREDVLEEAFLKPPPVVRLANRLGKTLLSVEELQWVTTSGDGGRTDKS